MSAKSNGREGNRYALDLNKFGVNVSNQLKDKTVGWAVAIYQGFGSKYAIPAAELKYSNSGGNAVLSPSTKMTSGTRMDVMSMSKTISAAAVVALLPWKLKTIDSPISPYLPSSWTRGQNVTQLTFRMILTHTTGLKAVAQAPDTDSTAYANLEKMIENGVTGNVPATGSYLNEGYALLRVILPYLWHGSEQMDLWESESPESFPQFVAEQYVDICKNWVLAWPSLKDVSVVPTGPAPFTRIYNFQDTSQSRASGKMTDILHAGHDHWYMSAREYGRLIADLRMGTYVAGTTCWATMTQSRAANAGSLPGYPGGDSRLGVWRFEGQHGEYFGHNGGYQFGGTSSNVVGSFAGWMAFPNNVTAVFLANSNLYFGYEQEKMLMDAYDTALAP